MATADDEALVFQCLDVVTRDGRGVKEEDSSDEGGAGGHQQQHQHPRPAQGSASPEDAHRAFEVLLFGCTAEGKSVCLTVKGFRPYFYVKLPEAWTGVQVAALRTVFLRAVHETAAPLVTLTETRAKELYYFNQGAKSRFLRVEVPSLVLWRRLRDLVLDRNGEFKAVSLGPSLGRVTLPVYEANIDPVLRLFHERDVRPAGWMRVNAGEWDEAEGGDVHAALVATAPWTSLHPLPERLDTAPMLVASWDIECTSSHGDFPLARKTWRKAARELVEGGVVDVEAAVAALASAIGGGAAPPLLPPAGAAAGPAIHLKGGGVGGTPAGPAIHLKGGGVGGTLVPPVVLSRVFLKPGAPAALAHGSATVAGVEKALRARLRYEPLARALAEAATSSAAHDAAARDAAIGAVDAALSAALPAVEGDPVIQVGVVLYRRGEPVSHWLWSLGSCDAGVVAPPGGAFPTHVIACRTEAELLRSFHNWLRETDPDVVIGYNVFGFDERYVWERSVETQVTTLMPKREDTAKPNKSPLSAWSRFPAAPAKLEERFLSSAAMGDNTMHILGAAGRLQVDLLHYVRRTFANLDSYTLDNVAATFMSGAVTGALTPHEGRGENLFVVPTKSVKGAAPGRFLLLLDEENDAVADKCEVVAVLNAKQMVVRVPGGAVALAEHGAKAVRWAQVKDDISPRDIFAAQRGTAQDRARVGRYCIQDCTLVMDLFGKLDVLNNAVAMANVCSVPVTYIFMRGQGIKIESLVFKKCRAEGQLVRVLPSPARQEEGAAPKPGVEDATYEGAIVLDPKAGIYVDEPVAVLDFASLYPSTMISENISHDTLVWVKDYEDDACTKLQALQEGGDAYDNVPGVQYVDIAFDILRPDPASRLLHPPKVKTGVRVARYAQPPRPGSVGPAAALAAGGSEGTIPQILRELLAARKATRKAMPAEPDEFKRALMDALQNAFKVTANSLYGQLGSGTSKVRLVALAASVTAYGRKQLLFAKDMVEAQYGPGGAAAAGRCAAEHVYGDSVAADTPLLVWGSLLGRSGTTPRYVAVHALALLLPPGTVWSPWHQTAHDGEFGKEAVLLWPGDLYVWVERPEGQVGTWTSVTRLIRHRLPAGTRLWRVATPAGFVDCTGDHSLLAAARDAQGQDVVVRPSELQRGTQLLTADPVPAFAILGTSRLALQQEFLAHPGLECGEDGALRKVVVHDGCKTTAARLYVAAAFQGLHAEVATTLEEGGPITLHLRPMRNEALDAGTVAVAMLATQQQTLVYDLQTANHHFGVGPGALVVHNTDSVFIAFKPADVATGVRLHGEPALALSKELAEEAGALVTSCLKPPHDFEFDKLFRTFCLISKKRYVGDMTEGGLAPEDFHRKSMGIVLKRRDNAPVVKMVYGGAIERVLDPTFTGAQGIREAYAFVRAAAADLLAGRVPVHKLTITKSLRAEYADPSRIAHKVLADRIKARDPGNAPQSGDRLPYAYVAQPAGTPEPALQGDRIETPAYIREHGLEVDSVFYLTNQISKPVSQVFALALEQLPGFRQTDLDARLRKRKYPTEAREEYAAQLLFGDLLRDAINARRGQRSIASFFDAGK